MTQISSSSDWINAYLEWTGAESVRVAVEDHAEQSAAVYLEWIDAAPRTTQREAMLLMALRTESEFMRILRQALEDESRMGWPDALENIETDMRALSSRIVELRAH